MRMISIRHSAAMCGTCSLHTPLCSLFILSWSQIHVFFFFLVLGVTPTYTCGKTLKKILIICWKRPHSYYWWTTNSQWGLYLTTSVIHTISCYLRWVWLLLLGWLPWATGWLLQSLQEGLATPSSPKPIRHLMVSVCSPCQFTTSTSCWWH